MPTATSQFATPNASRYLKQLCKHFAHKVEADFDDAEGRAALPGGQLILNAGPEALTIRIEGEDTRGMTKARYVLEDHLVRFAFRENLLGLHWSFEA
ncbi:MAG: DUF2218 domain-containing protein [Pseudomonadota bacterium]